MSRGSRSVRHRRPAVWRAGDMTSFTLFNNVDLNCKHMNHHNNMPQTAAKMWLGIYESSVSYVFIK